VPLVTCSFQLFSVNSITLGLDMDTPLRTTSLPPLAAGVSLFYTTILLHTGYLTNMLVLT
jgi:hypothetical protein